jgi:hypothetical protein
MKGYIMQNVTTTESTEVSFSTKVGAWVLMCLLIVVTGVLPGAFLFIFLNGFFTTIYLGIENFLHAGKLLDNKAKELNEHLKDGKPTNKVFKVIGERIDPMVDDALKHFNLKEEK